ncbi:MAG: hypothetical protein HON90_02430 [Halobacteriovoraceae bacterium]|jgi:hypothetical protein|nr:hypothetical protein [Halobacteriovoraceae bacterium]
MEAQDKEQWIFYLKLTKELSKDYFILDQKLKQSDKSLVPVTMKSLLESTKKYKSIHVVIVVKSFQEFRYFNKKVKKMMKYLMMTERVHIYIASSFVAMNDPSIMKRDFYNFMKLPVSIDLFCHSIARTIDLRDKQANIWPGGASPKMTIAS